jgi:aspartate ammonia-lyase
VSILAYGLGTGISRNINAKEVLTNIATKNKGHFTIIKDGSKEKLNSAFGSYYQYFVTAIGISIKLLVLKLRLTLLKLFKLLICRTLAYCIGRK